MPEGDGRTILTWGVKEKEGQVNRVTGAYSLWMTPDDAIKGICGLTGKSWDQLTKEGATLVQMPVVVYDKPDQ
jgi:hypothetical protein